MVGPEQLAQVDDQEVNAVPPLPTITDVFRCAINWHNSAAGLSAENVIHILAPTKTSADVASALDAHVQAHQFESMSSGTAAPSVTITKLDGSTATLEFALTNWVGSSGSGDVTPSAGVIVSLKTALRGRSHRGRVYLPFALESVQSQGLIGSANALEIQNAWTDWQTAMVAAGFTHVVASYKLASAIAVAKYFVPTQLAVQRRRQARLRFP